MTMLVVRFFRNLASILFPVIFATFFPRKNFIFFFLLNFFCLLAKFRLVDCTCIFLIILTVSGLNIYNFILTMLSSPVPVFGLHYALSVNLTVQTFNSVLTIVGNANHQFRPS